jgi:hypothetical protein
VWADSQPPDGVEYGADVFLAYRPGRGDPGIHDNLQWIQVIDWVQGPPPQRQVDNDLRASPFYIAGGLTSINGEQRVTFSDQPRLGIMGANVSLSDHFVSEIFLARDTGRKDAAHKASSRSSAVSGTASKCRPSSASLGPAAAAARRG